VENFWLLVLGFTGFALVLQVHQLLFVTLITYAFIRPWIRGTVQTGDEHHVRMTVCTAKSRPPVGLRQRVTNHDQIFRNPDTRSKPSSITSQPGTTVACQNHYPGIWMLS
jgi:uncharacterized protein (DUF58 family)